MGQKWNSLDVKNRIAYISAITAFVIGWGLTIAGFIIGKGTIHESVLWVLGQSLVYAASVFGVGMYVTSEVRHMKRDMRDFMRRRDNDYNDIEEEDIDG